MLKGNGTLGGSPLQIGTEFAEITRHLAPVDEMVASGMMAIMHRLPSCTGIAKRLDSDSERKIRAIAKRVSGSEIVFERAVGSFTCESDVKSEGEGVSTPKKTEGRHSKDGPRRAAGREELLRCTLGRGA